MRRAPIARRRMLEGAAGLLLLGASRQIDAAALPTIPPQTAGPFYPLALPPESDNDLVQIVGRAETAKGTVTYLSGHVLDPTGRRISGDANGRYHYVRDDRADRPLDEYFQGYGQMATDGTGGYRLRTIRPVPYPGRTPHIISQSPRANCRASSRRCMSPASPATSMMGVFMSVRDPAARARLIVSLRPAHEKRSQRSLRHFRHCAKPVLR
jgi:protocatechuate 3,4-dioxygenase, beta subunit